VWWLAALIGRENRLVWFAVTNWREHDIEMDLASQL
jgi:hypothetical protein